MLSNLLMAKEKVKAVVRLQSIEDVASLIVLYLEGSALALYLGMDEE